MKTIREISFKEVEQINGSWNTKQFLIGELRGQTEGVDINQSIEF